MTAQEQIRQFEVEAAILQQASQLLASVVQQRTKISGSARCITNEAKMHVMRLCQYILDRRKYVLKRGGSKKVVNFWDYQVVEGDLLSHENPQNYTSVVN